MTPAQQNISVRRGDTKELFFRVRTKVWNSTTLEWEPGPYRDLTGHTWLAQVRETKDATDILFAFTVTMGDQEDPVDGVGSVFLKASAALTASVPSVIGTGVYDVQVTEPDGDVYTWLEGTVTFQKDVSRA